MSRQERASWITLAINLIVAIGYFSGVLGMPGEVDVYSREMARLIIRITFISIVLAIAAEILIHWLSDQPRDVIPGDERLRRHVQRHGFQARRIRAHHYLELARLHDMLHVLVP